MLAFNIHHGTVATAFSLSAFVWERILSPIISGIYTAAWKGLLFYFSNVVYYQMGI